MYNECQNVWILTTKYKYQITNVLTEYSVGQKGQHSYRAATKPNPRMGQPIVNKIDVTELLDCPLTLK